MALVKRFLVPDHGEDFTANPVELFFDLAFVFAFSQLVGRLIDDPTLTGVAGVGLLFLLLWLPWTQFTWSANAVSAHQRPIKVLLLIATAASVPMAASVSTAFTSGGLIFASSLVVILAMGLAPLVIGFETGTAESMSARAYAIPNAIAGGLLVLGAFFDGGVRVAIWVVGLVVVIIGTLQAANGDWVVRPGHFAERHGLILIVALGEVIVATGIPVVASLEAGQGLDGSTVASLTAAGVFAALLWWGYFDRPQPKFEHECAKLVGRERAMYVRDVYTYWHAFIVAGIVFSAAALEEIALHPGDILPEPFRWMFVAGLGLYLGGIDVAIWRSVRRFAPERAIAGIVIVALVFVGSSMSGLTLLILVDVIIAVALIIEHLRQRRLEA